MSAAAFSPVVLHYFDGRGRAEPIRWMLEETNTAYSESLIRSKADMARVRQSGKLLYNQVPMLEVDGLALVQTDAILRYLARKNSMLGEELAEAATVDMVFAATTDIRGSVLGIPFNPPSSRPAILKACVEQVLPKYLAPIERLLGASKTGFVAGGGVTLADVALAEALSMVTEGPFAPPGMLLQQGYPAAHRHLEMMLARPGLAQYTSSGRRRAFSGDALLQKYATEVRDALS